MEAFKRNDIELRERWLSDLAALMVPIIAERAGLTFPRYRVTCGFPSRGGELGGKKRVAGQCWSSEASADRHAEIFISPVEDDLPTVAAILAHELIHSALPSAGHRKPFQNAATKIGHQKPFTSSVPTPDFVAWTAPLLEQLGPYPHARLNAMRAVGARKKQAARLLKADCGCGYTVRVTRKWVDLMGAPHCPQHGEMSVQGGEDEDGDA